MAFDVAALAQPFAECRYEMDERVHMHMLDPHELRAAVSQAAQGLYLDGMYAEAGVVY
jgi:hypothetical protein